MISLELLYWGELIPKTIFLVTRPSSEISQPERAIFDRRTKEYNTLARREHVRSRMFR